MSGERVIVVGGGAIGAACAYYLSKAGWRVTVLDKGRFGGGCSHGNCGFVCPSHVLPLAAPGAIGPALRALFSRNSAFSIKPRFDPSLWRWLWRFARRCNAHDMMEAARAIAALLNSSRDLYDELMEKEPFDCEWQPDGLLFVFQSKKAKDHYEETQDDILNASFGLRVNWYDGDGVVDQEPALKPGLAGGCKYWADAHLRPDRLMADWHTILERRGVSIVENCEVTAFAREGSRARAVVTPRGQLEADAFVLATGAWTPLLGRHLGCSIPIQPGKGYSITMARPAKCPTLPMIFEEHRVAVTPLRSALRLGSTMEFAGYDTTLKRSRIDLLRQGARHYLQEPEGDPVLEEWYGWRPMTFDGKPIIDRSPVLGNVLVAAGHGMLGVSMAPATGKLVAEMVCGTATHLDRKPYAVSRF